MSRGVIVALVVVAITSQLVGLWVLRTISFHSKARTPMAVWVRKVSIISMLVSGGLFFVVRQNETPLEIIFIASFAGWAVSNLLLWRTRAAVHRGGIADSTWSPFQSPEVREVCAHLTPTEHTRLIEDARERGRKIGLWFAVPLAVVGGLLYWSWRLGLILTVLFVGYFLLWALPRFRKMRAHSIELLCETEWARSQNYVPARLRLMTFPWSR
jgi:hypothetical protein